MISLAKLLFLCIPAVLFAIVLGGCKTDTPPVAVPEAAAGEAPGMNDSSDGLSVKWKYQVLIGTKSVPDYDAVAVGDSFDIDRRLMVFGADEVGNVNVYRDGVLMSTYRKGMILFMGDSGAFFIEGESGLDLFVYILAKVDGDRDIVVMKDEIPSGIINGVKFSISD